MFVFFKYLWFWRLKIEDYMGSLARNLQNHCMQAGFEDCVQDSPGNLQSSIFKNHTCCLKTPMLFKNMRGCEDWRLEIPRGVLHAIFKTIARKQGLKIACKTPPGIFSLQSSKPHKCFLNELMLCLKMCGCEDSIYLIVV